MTDRAREMAGTWIVSPGHATTMGETDSLAALLRSYAAEVLEKAAEEVDELPQFITKRQVVLSTLRARAAAEREGSR